MTQSDTQDNFCASGAEAALFGQMLKEEALVKVRPFPTPVPSPRRNPPRASNDFQHSATVPAWSSESPGAPVSPRGLSVGAAPASVTDSNTGKGCLANVPIPSRVTAVGTTAFPPRCKSATSKCSTRINSDFIFAISRMEK